MKDNPVELIVAAFQDEKGGKEALTSLREARKLGLIKIENAALLRKDEKGKLHIKETQDLGGGKGAAFGGVAGAAIGLIAGPALVVPAIVGALFGGLTAKLRDSGFSNQRLETLGEGLKPGSSAIVAVVEHTWVNKVEEVLAQAEADMTTVEIKADIAAQLEAGQEVAYSVLSQKDHLLAERTVVGEDIIESGILSIDGSGVNGSRFVATETGFIVEEMSSSANGFVIKNSEGVENEEDKK